MRGAEADATNAGGIISSSPAFHITFLVSVLSACVSLSDAAQSFPPPRGDQRKRMVGNLNQCLGMSLLFLRSSTVTVFPAAY